MKERIKFYKVTELPSKEIDRVRVLEGIGKQNFLLIYDFAKSMSMIGLDGLNTDCIAKIKRNVPGMSFSAIQSNPLKLKNDYIVFSVYRSVNKYDNRLFSDSFNVLSEGFISIVFINVDSEEIDLAKTHAEEILSSKGIRETESSPSSYFGNKTNSTMHKELYYDSEERLMLSNIVESLNSTILGNGLAHKIFLLIPKAHKKLYDYITTHFLVLSEYVFNNESIESLINNLAKKPSLPSGFNYSKEFINFYGFHDINHILPTFSPFKETGINMGNFVKYGFLETSSKIKVALSAFNLGFIVTGLPGSGKTREVMSILNSFIQKSSNKKPTIFVITPTAEWKEFALSHNMFFIELYGDNTPINFFRCPPNIESEKFYGNLAMILSSSADAGPYRNPMEKCMLNAFRKVYANNTTPDPVIVYGAIEDSIIRYHGKIMPSGIKYTKHGENIKSSLENLRGIIGKEQYCVKDGIRIEDFLDNGVIFDISSASISTRRQLYALVLNQIYSLTTKFDTEGDNELRLVICLEEAQTIFGDPYSPAVQDIKQRIQDFRKQGIGLILITHNVSDIDVGIRRLCQLKLYLKQASDTAVLAFKDLIFTYVDQDEAVLKLKTLGSRIGALSYISKKDTEKRQQDTVFIKTMSYNNEPENSLCNPITSYLNKNNLNAVKVIKCKIAIKISENKQVRNKEQGDFDYIRVNFLGEETAIIESDKLDSSELNLLEGKEYKIEILNKKKRILKEFYITASEKINFYVE